MKEYIKEKAQAITMARSGKGGSAVHLVEEEFTEEILEMSLDEAIEALGDPPTNVILALVAKRQQWRTDSAKKPFRPGAARPKAAARPTTPAKLTDKDGKLRCVNCGRSGHDKDSCRQKKLDRTKRPCFECGEPGHLAANCPKKATSAHTVEEEGDEDVIVAMVCDPEEQQWQEPPRHRRARAAALCGTRGRCSCGCLEVPAMPLSFEVLGNDSDSSEDTDSEMGDLDESSSEENFGVDQDEDNESDGEESEADSGPCCGYACTSRGVPCRRKMIDELIESVSEITARTLRDEKVSELVGAAKDALEESVQTSTTEEPSLPSPIAAVGEEPTDQISKLELLSMKLHGNEQEDRAEEKLMSCIKGLETQQNSAGGVTADTVTSGDSLASLPTAGRPGYPRATSTGASSSQARSSTISPDNGSGVMDTTEEEEKIKGVLEAEYEHQWEILKSAIPGYLGPEERRRRAEYDLAVKEYYDQAKVIPVEAPQRTARIKDSQELKADKGDVNVKIAAETRRLPTLWPKQHYGKPDYIKMYVWGEWLDCFDEMFNDDDPEDEESVHEEDPRQPAALEVQFLDQEVIEELELNMASTEEKEFFLEPFEVAIDSGAGEHVTSGEDVPGYAIEPRRGSKVGQNFITAGKTKIPNKGQVHLNLRAGERVKGKGKDIKTIFQVADIKRPLWSVSKICDAGFTVKFDRDAAVVLDSKGKECVRFERRGGLYVAKLMLRNPKYKNADEGFQRPGK